MLSGWWQFVKKVNLLRYTLGKEKCNEKDINIQKSSTVLDV